MDERERTIRDMADSLARALLETWDDAYLSPEQVCELVPGMTVANLKDMRTSGKGPAFRKPTGERGKVTVYRQSDVIARVESSVVTTREQS